MVHVFARVKGKEGSIDALKAILLELVAASRAEAGVVRYDLFQTNDSGEFLFHEEYADDVAFESHKASRHLVRAVRRAARHMEGGLTLWEVNPLSSA